MGGYFQGEVGSCEQASEAQGSGQTFLLRSLLTASRGGGNIVGVQTAQMCPHIDLARFVFKLESKGRGESPRVSPVKQKMQKNQVVVQIESQVQYYYLVRLVHVVDLIAPFLGLQHPQCPVSELMIKAFI